MRRKRGKGAGHDDDEEVSMRAGGNPQPSTGEAAGLPGGREMEADFGLSDEAPHPATVARPAFAEHRNPETNNTKGSP